MTEKNKTTKKKAAKPRLKKKKTISEQDKLQANNLLEQASDIMSNVTYSGKCKALSPIIKATGQEHLGPRGQAILLKEKILDKTFFETTLCKGAEIKCPLNTPIDEAIIKAREAMVLKGMTTKQNEKMIENLRATGNPYINAEGEEDTNTIYA